MRAKNLISNYIFKYIKYDYDGKFAAELRKICTAERILQCLILFVYLLILPLAYAHLLGCLLFFIHLVKSITYKFMTCDIPTLVIKITNSECHVIKTGNTEHRVFIFNKNINIKYQQNDLTLKNIRRSSLKITFSLM